MQIKEYVQKRKEELRDTISKLDRKPTLCVISVGENPASQAYIKGKMKDSNDVGFNAIHVALPEETTQEELDNVIFEKNKDPNVGGILVQLPIPKHLSSERVNEILDPNKDVDGFVPNTKYICCTPKGIIDYLTSEGFSFEDKKAVVMGRSHIVGAPVADLLRARHCEVNVIHSKTTDEDRRKWLKEAELIVVAVGKRDILNKSYELNPEAYVVDVGINRDEFGKLHGDCEPNLPVKLQTPVPGGVGLLTRLALLDNLLEASKY